jgi:hypothetical protein
LTGIAACIAYHSVWGVGVRRTHPIAHPVLRPLPPNHPWPQIRSIHQGFLRNSLFGPATRMQRKAGRACPGRRHSQAAKGSRKMVVASIRYERVPAGAYTELRSGTLRRPDLPKTLFDANMYIEIWLARCPVPSPSTGMESPSTRSIVARG